MTMTTLEKLMLRYAQAQTALLVGIFAATAATAGCDIKKLEKELQEVENLSIDTDKALGKDV